MRHFLSYQEIKQIQSEYERTVVGIGNFDGLHRGHQALLHAVLDLSHFQKLIPSILTFDPHPLRFFRGSQGPRQIYSAIDRQMLLNSLGIELTLTQKFTHDFASLSPHDFVKEVLVDAFQAKYVVVGYDFAFGAKRAGTLDDLIEFGRIYDFNVKVIEAQIPEQDHFPRQTDQRPFSSTWIRELIINGDVDIVTQALGRPYHLRAKVVRGLQRGRKLGFPTANLELTSELCPSPGVYAGWLDWEQGPKPAVISIGSNPTFDQAHLPSSHQKWSVEVHVLDVIHPQELNLYEQEVALWFTKRLRDMERFSTVEALIAQIKSDCEQATNALLSEGPPTWPLSIEHNSSYSR